MWQRFTLHDLRVIGHYLGTLIMFSVILMVVPLIVALVLTEWEPALRYLFGIGITLTAGAGLRFLRIEPGRLNRQQALVVVGLAWIVLALFCTIPLYMSGHYASYLDALFEGVSGLTTTGASLVVDLDHISYADNIFRFMMHMFGGVGLIVVTLSIGLFGKRTGSSLFTSEGRTEHVVPNVVQTARFIVRITLIVVAVGTALLMLLCMLEGMEPVRALINAFGLAVSGFETGGMTPMAQSITYYHSVLIELVLMMLMIMGAINFVLYAEVFNGRIGNFFRDIEVRTAVIWVGAMTLIVTAALAAGPLFSDVFAILRRGLFMVVSAFTTTGFQIITTNELTAVLTSGAFFALGIVMAVGGSAGSTTGGIKLFRVGIIFKSIVSTVKETLAPDSARVVVSYGHVGRRILSSTVVKEAMTVFVLYVVTYVVGALVGIAHGYDATQAIFESVAMASNGGIITGIASPGMPATLELFYIFEMWVGRLEFVTLLAVVAQVVVSILPRRRARG